MFFFFLSLTSSNLNIISVLFVRIFIKFIYPWTHSCIFFFFYYHIPPLTNSSMLCSWVLFLKLYLSLNLFLYFFGTRVEFHGLSSPSHPAAARNARHLHVPRYSPSRTRHSLVTFVSSFSLLTFLKVLTYAGFHFTSLCFNTSHLTDGTPIFEFRFILCIVSSLSSSVT